MSATTPPQRVIVTGASGLIGRALVPFLRARGHEVRTLGRAASSDLQWRWEQGTLDPQALAGCGAVVHLAGEPLTGRWTAEKRRAIMESRRVGSRLLAEALAAAPQPPPLLISASAVGYYGDRNDAVLTESDGPGRGYLSEVCQAWEAATQPAEQAGLRVVHLRLGVVAASSGGAFPLMLLPLRYGLGGRIGSGQQYLSWIALPDLLSVIGHCLDTETLSGPVNAVAPEPVTNARFTTLAARLLHRPALLTAPAFALRAVLGESADEMLLSSARVTPRRLLDTGFAFKYPELAPTLSALLRREL